MLTVQWSDGHRIHFHGGFTDYESAEAWARAHVPPCFHWIVTCDA